MTIVAVVLNWRRPDDTIACVDSLRAHAPGTEVVVVDNASGDDSAPRIRSAHPDVTVIEHDRNAGYAGGNNVGIRAALERGARGVLVLNNDLTIEPGCVDALAAALTDGVPIVGPVSYAADDPSRVDFYRTRLDLRNMAIDADGRGARDLVVRDSETDYVTGSAMLIDADVLRALGGFDEDFFLVWEDVDLSLRARAHAGAPLRVVADARVLHKGSASFGGSGSPLYQYFFVRNSFLIVRKHVGRLRRSRVRDRIRARYEGWSAKAEPAVAEAIAAGLRDGLAARYGPPPASVLPA